LTQHLVQEDTHSKLLSIDSLLSPAYSFSQRMINRWNSLDQETVNAATVNRFKSRLSKLRSKKMGLLLDRLSDEPLGHIRSTGVATPGELPGEYVNK